MESVDNLSIRCPGRHRDQLYVRTLTNLRLMWITHMGTVCHEKNDYDLISSVHCSFFIHLLCSLLVRANKEVPKFTRVLLPE